MSNNDFYSRYHVDPIVVEEERARLAAHATEMGKGAAAADALTWFAEYSRSGPKGVLDLKAAVRAGSTPKVDKALTFVQRALADLEPEILRRAIELANGEFQRASEARKADGT